MSVQINTSQFVQVGNAVIPFIEIPREFLSFNEWVEMLAMHEQSQAQEYYDEDNEYYDEDDDHYDHSFEDNEDYYNFSNSRSLWN